MKTQTIVYVTDMARSIEFYSKLGFEQEGPASDYWTPFRAGTETLALHWSEATDQGRGAMGLGLVADRPLEELAADLEAVSIPSTEIKDQPFGRSFNITDPDGLVIQVNEHAS